MCAACVSDGSVRESTLYVLWVTRLCERARCVCMVWERMLHELWVGFTCGGILTFVTLVILCSALLLQERPLATLHLYLLPASTAVRCRWFIWRVDRRVRCTWRYCPCPRQVHESTWVRSSSAYWTFFASMSLGTPQISIERPSLASMALALRGPTNVQWDGDGTKDPACCPPHPAPPLSAGLSGAETTIVSTGGDPASFA